MYKRTGMTLPYSQEIIEPWPGVWQFDFRQYFSLADARSARAALNKANGIHNYEEANNDD